MVLQFVTIAVAFVWAGCIMAISFMEAWLKFRAPGVSTPIGLGIGKLIFNALNKMEWVFAAIILVCCIIGAAINVTVTIWFVISGCILLVQTIWLLPALEVRASSIINGKTPSPSTLHWYFVGAEFLKILTLIILGWNLFIIAV
ncbi:MAG: hypothetical protein ABJB05_01590 [Parafilimonas sp.]